MGLIDLTGMRFNRLIVIRQVNSGKHSKPRWLCICDCGQVIETQGSQLRRGQTQSCGCLQRERTKSANTSHGMKGSRVYRIWSGIKNRCLNKNSKDFPRYGGSGISICDEWITFDSFYADLGDPPSDRHEVDRIDNSIGYCKSNCRWATDTQQAQNRSSSLLVSHDGVTACASAWDVRLGFRKGTIARRKQLGWSDVDAVSVPLQTQFSRKQK